MHQEARGTAAGSLQKSQEVEVQHAVDEIAEEQEESEEEFVLLRFPERSLNRAPIRLDLAQYVCCGSLLSASPTGAAPPSVRVTRRVASAVEGKQEEGEEEDEVQVFAGRWTDAPAGLVAVEFAPDDVVARQVRRKAHRSEEVAAPVSIAPSLRPLLRPKALAEAHTPAGVAESPTVHDAEHESVASQRAFGKAAPQADRVVRKLLLPARILVLELDVVATISASGVAS